MSEPSPSSSGGGQSDKSCCCQLHSSACAKYPNLSNDLVSLNNYRILPKELTTPLGTHCPGFSRRSNHSICNACVTMLKDMYEPKKQDAQLKKRKASTSPKQDQESSFSTFLAQIESREFTTDELQQLLHVLGRKLANGVAEHVSSRCRIPVNAKVKEMTTQSIEDVWKDSYGPLRSFLQGIIDGVETIRPRNTSTSESLRRTRYLHHSLEGIYSAVNSKFVSSFALAELLYMYFLSNSRKACEIHAASSGSASFSSLQNILATIGKSTPVIPSQGYVVVAFDNNQVFGKTYRVQLESKFRAHVVTTVSAFLIKPPNNPQEKEMKFPLFLNLNDNGKETLLTKLTNFRSSAKNIVKDRLKECLQSRLDHLMKPENFDPSDKEFRDYVYSNVPCKSEINKIPHHNVQQQGFECNIFDQPCILANPNSYKNVERVLSEILNTSLSNDRKWITVVADGLPYSIAQELVRRWIKCTECNEEFLDTDATNHYTENHKINAPATHTRKFDRILIRPGAGHYEMNILRSIFAAWFNIFIEPVAELMGFRSTRAKLYCASGADHHKSWQLLEILFESLSDELMYSYMCHFYHGGSYVQGNLPSVEDFMNSVSTCTNEFMKGAYQFLYEFCFPLMLYRSGVRQCNFEVTIAAREYAAAVFYAFRHPKYQKINCYDIAELLQMPKDFRSAVHNESFRIPGSASGQGVDFLLEQRNKKLKAFVVHNGIPTEEQWMQASKSLPTLEEIVDAVSNRMNFPVTEKKTHSYVFKEEKLAVRGYFRSTGYFDLNTSVDLKTTNDEKVCDDFLKCRQIAEDNQRVFYEEFIKTGKAKSLNLVESIKVVKPAENWTVVKLKEEIKNKSACLPEDQKKEFCKGIWSLRKDDLIKRYMSLIERIEEIDIPEDTNIVVYE